MRHMNLTRWLGPVAAILLAGCGPAAEAPTSRRWRWLSRLHLPRRPQRPRQARGGGAADRATGRCATGAGTLSADIGEVRPADPAKFHKEPGYSPYAGRRYPERPYFGDEHVHTAWSVDAGGIGRDARARGGHALCARRGSHLDQRPAGEARHSRSTGSPSPITPTAWA